MKGARVIAVLPRLWPTWGAGTQRTTALVRGLVRAGAEVSAMVAAYERPVGKPPPGLANVDLHVATHPWTRLPWQIHHSAMVVGARDALAPAHARLARRAAELTADVVVASGPPWSALELAAHIAGKRDIPFAADLRDEWSANPFQRWLGPAYHALSARREVRALSAASLITAPFAAVIENLREQPSCDAIVLPHGCDTELILHMVGAPPPLRADESLRLLFAGARYGMINEARLLSVASRALQPLPNIHLQLVGARRSLTVDPPTGMTVEIVAQVSHDTLMGYYSRAHALLAFGPRERGPGWIPSKLEEYRATGRPIFAFADPAGDLAARVSAMAGGYVADENDPTALHQTLTELRRACESRTDFRTQRVLRDWDDLGREWAAAVARVIVKGTPT